MEWSHEKIFIPSWISCLDKSISVWTDKLTFQGFVFYTRKNHTKGNKYHTICCGEIGILYDWDIGEGRNHPIPMGRTEFETSPNMKTGGLII